jgi:hypothetical protein
VFAGRRAAATAVADDPSVELKALIVGSRETISGTVYGTIVLLAALVAGAKPYENDLWRLSVIVAMSVLVLWFAHVYSDGIGESLELGRRLSIDELGSIARRELSIPLAAVVPVGLLVLGAVDVFHGRTAIWLAFGAGVATLSVQGIRYALLERMSVLGTVFSVALNIGVALMLVVLKVVVAH